MSMNKGKSAQAPGQRKKVDGYNPGINEPSAPKAKKKAPDSVLDPLVKNFAGDTGIKSPLKFVPKKKKP